MQDFRTTDSEPQAQTDEAEWPDLSSYAFRAIGIGAAITFVFWLFMQ
jgi:hypothetical protein